MLGLAAAGAVHALAGAAMLPVVRLSAPDWSHPSDASAPVTVVQLVHLVPRAGAAAPQPEDAPESRAISLPEPPAPFEAALSDPDSRGESPPGRVEDDDPLYRAPFRDAVAQADSRLRAGLNCDHVDLPQLPKTLFDLCAAAGRLRQGRG